MAKRSSKPKPPTDVNQLGKYVIDRIAGAVPAPKPKNPRAVALGKLGGAKGGQARAKKLTAAQRSAIAKKAAAARWKNGKST